MYPDDIPKLITQITQEAKDDPENCPHICLDSRKVRKGDIFIALPSTTDTRDGGAFIADAVARGCQYVICTPRTLAYVETEDNVVYAPSKEPREALAYLARARYGSRALDFPIIAITGTNGKTTTSYILNHIYTHLGKKTGIIGTIAYAWPGHFEEATLTTPDCIRMHTMLVAMQKAGVNMAFIEASSHALDQGRLEGIDLMGAIFTNLTQDHLDYHLDMQEYFNAKARLFTNWAYRTKTHVVNTDDLWGKELHARILASKYKAIAFGFNDPPSDATLFLRGEILRQDVQGLHLRMTYGKKSWEIQSPLIGRFNAENLLAAQGLCLGHGLKPEVFACLSSFTGISGRLERISNPQNLPIFVDYAHTPDALENVLSTLKQSGFARIITIFGCGGDRDTSKRPLMGQAVAKYSDIALVTSDNPRHENPLAIIEAIKPGLTEAKQVIIEPDRRLAIEKAIAMMTPQDVLLIAGKGHEQTQQIGDVKHAFSDQATVREILGCA